MQTQEGRRSLRRGQITTRGRQVERHLLRQQRVEWRGKRVQERAQRRSGRRLRGIQARQGGLAPAAAAPLVMPRGAGTFATIAWVVFSGRDRTRTAVAVAVRNACASGLCDAVTRCVCARSGSAASAVDAARQHECRRNARDDLATELRHGLNAKCPGNDGQTFLCARQLSTPTSSSSSS